MTQALCTGSEGSKKWAKGAKGAKGAISFVCALLHTPRSLHVQFALVSDSARGENCVSRSRIADKLQDRFAVILWDCSPNVAKEALLAGGTALGQVRTKFTCYLYGGIVDRFMAEHLFARLLASLDKRASAQNANWKWTAACAPYQLTTDLSRVVGGTA